MLDLLLYSLAATLGVPIGVVCLEYLAAALYRRRKFNESWTRPPISVLIPAHNEEQSLVTTMDSVKRQLNPSDHMLVVADNCTDKTAAVAHERGAEVLERFDEENRGKGFALDAGLRRLAETQKHGEAVFMIDADCTLDANAIDWLVESAMRTGRPTQGTYLMHRPADAGPGAIVSELAFTLKNHARALGDEMLGWPCVLRGSGMAFPWPLLRDRDVASDDIVEDVKIGLELTVDGKPPRFCPEAFIRSQLPTSQEASTTQRTRWEHGYMAMVAKTPGLLWMGITQLNWKLFGTAAILSIPPLSMHCAACVLSLLLAAAAWGLGWASVGPMIVIAIMGLAFACCTLLAWYRFARKDIPFGSLVLVPTYIVRKLPIYLRFFTGRERKWIRTSRT